MNKDFDILVDKSKVCLPLGVTIESLYSWLVSLRIDGSNVAELEGYLDADFLRFVYTLSLVLKSDKNMIDGLEFGANPYFTSVLLNEFSLINWRYSNYFGSTQSNGLKKQSISINKYNQVSPESLDFEYDHFNSEVDPYPYRDESLDIILYCEIFEHLLHSPMKVLRQLHGLLKADGTLILTTPNVARLENVRKLAEGLNIYDPYSGYGPYGRHNREYTVAEIEMLMKYTGFEIEEIFTADVHKSYKYNRKDDIFHMIKQCNRGQYIFCRAVKKNTFGNKKLDWLYRSIPDELLASNLDDKRGLLNAKLETIRSFNTLQQYSVVNIQNTGIKMWNEKEYVLGARAYDETGNLLREFRGDAISQLMPNDSVECSILLDLNNLVAEFIELKLDIVREYCFWFEDKGSSALRFVVRLNDNKWTYIEDTLYKKTRGIE